ncbi:hypothetical protein LTR17_024842 [Elasticomyces elasticus]|nr:hypothetical protein LTR17_024842 [Elasticomyces elasticus]
MVLSTFNDLGHAVEGLNIARQLHSTGGSTNAQKREVWERTTSVLLPIDGALSGNHKAILPHQLTVRMIHVAAAMLVAINASDLCSVTSGNAFRAPTAMLRSFFVQLETQVQSVVSASVSPLWPMLLHIVSGTLAVYSATSDSLDMWQSLSRTTETLATLSASPMLNLLYSHTRNCAAGSSSAVSNSHAAPGPSIASFQGLAQSSSQHATSTNIDHYVPPNDEITTQIVGISMPQGGPLGESISDVGSAAFDIMERDAIQWNESYLEGLHNMGFCADGMFVWDDAMTGIDDFLASAGNAS